MSDLVRLAGRRFARLATRSVVADARLWRVFRRPLQAQFDRLAPSWDAERGPDFLAPLAAAVDRLEGSPRRILDVGTGTGLGARLLARRFPQSEIVGVDLSPGMIAEARRLLPREFDGRVEFAVGDASALPFPDGRFDLVVLLNMIPFFDEIARVTVNVGTVIAAYSYGPDTPIYVPPETFRARLAPFGFGAFEDLRAGPGTALIARRR